MKKYPYLNKIEPDIDDLITVLKGKKKAKRLHAAEIFLDQEMKDALWAEYLGDDLVRNDLPDYHNLREVMLHRAFGYDMFRVPVIRKSVFHIKDTKTVSGGTAEAEAGRTPVTIGWIEEHKGPIQTWKDFETFPWPEVSAIDLRALEWMEKNLPENMGVYDLTAHIFEIISFMFGYEALCLKIYDDPQLVGAVAERVGSFYADYTGLLADFSRIPILWSADDMGFRSGLLMPPEFLRETVLPWHRKCAAIAHEHGKLYILHCCGNVEMIMDELIDDIGIDGKHSFEDAIMPVTEAWKKYGGRTAVLGGIDLDFLVRSDEEAIRRRVRETLDVCWQGSGYCLGTGNSAAKYLPADHYLAMLGEGWRHTGIHPG